MTPVVAHRRPEFIAPSWLFEWGVGHVGRGPHVWASLGFWVLGALGRPIAVREVVVWIVEVAGQRWIASLRTRGPRAERQRNDHGFQDSGSEHVYPP